MGSMNSAKISYAGVAGAVGGVVALIGVYADWWETSNATFEGTADISGSLALAMAIATFAFGAAFVLLSDARIRRAMGALMTLCAVVLVIACIWGTMREGDVAAGAVVANGLYLSMLGGAISVAAGILSLKDVSMTEAEVEGAGA
ncbi:MAG: hypothetical protein WD096_00480 [Actinomycetota bacterium]